MAADRERCSEVLRCLDVRTHLSQRVDNALHGASVQRCITGDRRHESLAGEDSRKEPDRSTGVSRVERVVGGMKAVQAAAVEYKSRRRDRRSDAERFQAGKRALGIGRRWKESFDHRVTVSKGPDQQCSMSNRFVRRDGESAAQGPCRCERLVHR